MERYVEIVYDVLFHPGIAMRTIATQKMVGGAVVIFFISLFLPGWVAYLVLKAMGLGKIATAAVVAQSLGYLAFWLLGTALFHLSAECLGGKGTALGLLSTLGFAQLPRIFLVPLLVLTALATGGLAKVFMVVFGIAISFWVLTLDVKGIKETYDLSTARAVAVMIIPFIILFLLILIMMLAVGMSIMH